MREKAVEGSGLSEPARRMRHRQGEVLQIAKRRLNPFGKIKDRRIDLFLSRHALLPFIFRCVGFLKLYHPKRAFRNARGA